MLRQDLTAIYVARAALSAAAIVLCAIASNAAPASLDNLSGLAKLEEMCTSNAVPSEQFTDAGEQIKLEFTLIRDELAKTPKQSRPAKLRELADRTQWGTPERAAAYYVCAWYGVNYERCRDYLLNSAFWHERGYHGKCKLAPYAWLEMGYELLYKLYEQNLDFQLLHDLMLGTSDGAGAEVLTSCKGDALWKHPRGVLHVAEISAQGRDYVARILAKRTGNPNLDYWFDDDKGRGGIFAQYVGRIAADLKDPLQPLAKELLRDAKRVK